MTIEDLRGIGHYTRPGYGEPEPVQPTHTCDPQENIDRCLDCPLKKCRPEHPTCPLNGGRQGRAEKISERDARVLELIRAGWVNNEAICEGLGIGRTTLTDIKRRLRERGEIT